MPVTVKKSDRELVDLLRGTLVPAYVQEFKRKGYDHGSAVRMAAKKFDSQLSRGELTVASQEERDAQAKAERSLKGYFKKLRVRMGLALMPKGGSQ